MTKRYQDEIEEILKKAGDLPAPQPPDAPNEKPPQRGRRLRRLRQTGARRAWTLNYKHALLAGIATLIASIFTGGWYTFAAGARPTDRRLHPLLPRPPPPPHRGQHHPPHQNVARPPHNHRRRPPLHQRPLGRQPPLTPPTPQKQTSRAPIMRPAHPNLAEPNHALYSPGSSRP